MTEAELEAVMRRELTAVAAKAMSEMTGTAALTRRMNVAVDAMLAAAAAYAVAEFGITADRRAELAAAVAPKGRRAR